MILPLGRVVATLAQYALGDDGAGDEQIVAPIEERIQALLEAINATEAHLMALSFDPATIIRAKGFARIKALKDAVEAVYASDDAKRRFEILARQVFIRFRSLLMEPSAYAYAESACRLAEGSCPRNHALWGRLGWRQGS